MFTGIVQDVGRLDASRPAAGGLRLEVVPSCPFEDLGTGESVATEGVCLTCEPESKPDRLIYFLSAETLSKTTLGDLEPGAQVNLERSLGAGDRLGGHLVMGHVDGVGTIRSLKSDGESWTLEVDFPEALRPFFASKGSVSINGISLTLVDVEPACFSVAIIPHTREVTSLRSRRAGDRVNLEVDTIARYVVEYLSRTGVGGGVDADLLKRAGFDS